MVKRSSGHVGRMNIKSSGNENDFGELTQARANGGGAGDRGIFWVGGMTISCNRSSNVLTTEGQISVDFGDLSL